MYLAPCFSKDERREMIQKYEHGLPAVILKKQHFGEMTFEKDSSSMIIRMQHIQAIAQFHFWKNSIFFNLYITGLLDRIRGCPKRFRRRRCIC